MKNKKNINEVALYSGDECYSERYGNDSYNSFRIKRANRLITQIESPRPFKKGNKVLDVGCGTGEIGRTIKENFDCDVYGLDINTIAVKKARENGIIAKVSNVEKKWPFKNSSIDTVLCIQMIEHLINPDFFLLESRRVLKKDGMIIITTPNLAAWFNRIIFLFGFQPFFTEVSTVDKTIGLSFTRNLTNNRKPMGHIRCFTLKALKEILELHGFKQILIRGSTVNYFPKYITLFDKIFSFFPSLAADLIVVARKK